MFFRVSLSAVGVFPFTLRKVRAFFWECNNHTLAGGLPLFGSCGVLLQEYLEEGGIWLQRYEFYITGSLALRGCAREAIRRNWVDRLILSMRQVACCWRVISEHVEKAAGLEAQGIFVLAVGVGAAPLLEPAAV